MSNDIRVAVIGAGAAGLCAARQLRDESDVSVIDVFEQTASLGGTWTYTDNTGLDQYGQPIHSSMYKFMRTNLPKEVMGFPDYPFKQNRQQASFLHHSKVLDYLFDYATDFNLHRYIKYKTLVKQVSFVDNVYTLTTQNVESRTVSQSVYDAVFICNGHYARTYQPDMKKQLLFKGSIIHSHAYREPAPYAGRRVLVIGAGPSGIDIAIELAQVCPMVYLSHRNKPFVKLCENIEQVGSVIEFTGDNAVAVQMNEDEGGETVDSKILEIDSVIFCTGYLFDFDFVDRSTIDLSVERGRVTPIYKHLIHIDHPTSLFIVGIPMTICPFPCFHVQIKYCLQLMLGKIKPKTKEIMLEWQQKDFDLRSEIHFPQHWAHKMGERQWRYFQDLCNEGNFANPIAPVIEKLYNHVHDARGLNLAGYKNWKYELIDKQEFKMIHQTNKFCT